MTTTTEVTKTLVPEAQRERFLPKHLGKNMLRFEAMVFDTASRYSDYTGGYWEFYELSNGGMFMAPSGGPKDGYHFKNGMNDADAYLSPEALGIVACLYAFSHLSFAGDGHAGDLFHLLLDYAYTLPEAAAIGKAID
ncbi:antirestriction protein [Candidimonas nitroreducens]|uniref:Antirestriction protein n=1 Tax=Candidimonas nitroreducens TaxID=683354 RepID=A0A225M3I5_9BURK|nr:antirestriction protein [Candidimonas nitroreducens]OWT55242.1 antirestriction protein [Candidimonas nitroreducens]